MKILGADEYRGEPRWFGGHGFSIDAMWRIPRGGPANMPHGDACVTIYRLQALTFLMGVFQF
jgi:hypothetical protein